MEIRTYAYHIAGQEDPEEMPSEVALHLSQLLGCPHHTAHRALVSVDPEVWEDAFGRVFLAYGEVGPVADEVQRLLLADARAYSQAWRLVKSAQRAQIGLPPGVGIEEGSDN